MDLFYKVEPNAKEKAQDYCYAYHSCISNGKSEIYAQAYADVESKEFCEIYADAYECAINHGMRDDEACDFGEFCRVAADRGCWRMLHDFKNKYKEEWQRLYYQNLTIQEYEEDMKHPITEKDFKELRKTLFGKL